MLAVGQAFSGLGVSLVLWDHEVSFRNLLLIIHITELQSN